MRIKIKAVRTGQTRFVLDGETINGIDLSALEHGDKFLWNAPELIEAGVRHAERDEAGELWVTLAMRTTRYQIPIRRHDWRGMGDDWMDASEYVEGQCYVTPTATDLPDNYELVETDNGWTVAGSHNG